MSFATLEREVLRQARIALNNRKLKMADILEWSTAEQVVKANAKPGESVIHLPGLGAWIAVLKENDKLQPK